MNEAHDDIQVTPQWHLLFALLMIPNQPIALPSVGIYAICQRGVPF
jgi:hypothetical protein